MIFISDDDRYKSHQLHEQLLARAREYSLSGATVWRGIEGFGQSRLLRTNRLPDANTGLPMVVEIIDDRERVTSFLNEVSDLVAGSLITLEDVSVVRGAPAPPAG
jgi:PII-like signaling protein